jgi:hypothetical protein
MGRVPTCHQPTHRSPTGAVLRAALIDCAASLPALNLRIGDDGGGLLAAWLGMAPSTLLSVRFPKRTTHMCLSYKGCAYPQTLVYPSAYTHVSERVSAGVSPSPGHRYIQPTACVSQNVFLHVKARTVSVMSLSIVTVFRERPNLAQLQVICVIYRLVLSTQ